MAIHRKYFPIASAAVGSVLSRIRRPATLREAKAGAMMEFAIVLPLYLLLIMGILEYSLVIYASTVLESSTILAAREGKTGYTATGQTQIQYITSILQNRVGGLLNPSLLQISAFAYSSFSTVVTPTFTNCGTPLPPCTQNLGSSGQVVVYTVTYPWQVMTPFLWPLLGKNGALTLSASAVVKNEPYSAASR